MAGAAHRSARLPFCYSLLKVGPVEDLLDKGGGGADNLSKMSQWSRRAGLGAEAMRLEWVVYPSCCTQYDHRERLGCMQ